MCRAIVQYSGTVGGAKSFSAGNHQHVSTCHGNGYGHCPHGQAVYVLSVNSASPVTLTINMATGPAKEGDRTFIYVTNSDVGAVTGNSGTGMAVCPAGFFRDGFLYEFMMLGGAWMPIDGGRSVAQILPGGFFRCGGQAAGNTVAIGRETLCSVPGSVAIAQSFVGGGANDAQANDVVIQGGSKTLRIYNDLILTTSATTANQELTLTGGAANSSTRFSFPILNAVSLAKVRVTLQGRAGASNNNDIGRTPTTWCYLSMPSAKQRSSVLLWRAQPSPVAPASHPRRRALA